MSRGHGSKSRATQAAVMSGCDILLDPKGTAEIRFTNSLGETMRVLAVEDQYVMLDMAAQLTTAVLTLQERRVASKS